MESKAAAAFRSACLLFFVSTVVSSAAAQKISLSTSSVSFGNITVGTTASTAVTLTNTGTASLFITSIVATGPGFSQTNTCPATVPAKSRCVITVSFAPTVTGSAKGAVAVTDNAPKSPQSIRLAGTGIQAAGASLISIAVTPSNISLGAGSNQQFFATGTYSDNSTKDLTKSVVWSSSFPSVATITNTGLARLVSAGVTQISASSGSVIGSTSLTSIAGGALSCSVRPLDLKVLLVASDGSEADFPAIKQILDYVGTPYTVFYTSTASLTADQLFSGCHGYYQGVIFTVGQWVYNLNGAQTLENYEQTFGVRQVNWYVFPGPDFGLNPSTSAVDTTNTPIQASFTTAAQPIFSYANTANTLTIQNAYTYLATALSDGATTPLLQDSSGNTLALIHTTSFAGDWLSLTFDSNQYLTHDLVLAYGLVNWVTKGLFLGDYHVYAAAQVDDVFIDDSEWIPSTACTDPTLSGDRTPVDSPLLPLTRITGTDIDSLLKWQSAKQQDPLLSTFTLSLALNGVGTTGDNDWTGLPNGAADTLTPEIQKDQVNFHFISHTYDHPDTLNNMTQAQINNEINSNNYVAIGQKGANIDKTHTLSPLGLTNYNPQNLVTPGVTGLNDPNVPQYLVNDGVRFVVTDTSLTPTSSVCQATPLVCVNNGPNPSPNVGIVNSYAQLLYEVPRHPNDIFYNTANWQDLEAEFDCIYSVTTTGQPAPTADTFGKYTAAQILDFVSSGFVTNMLLGDMDPQMFHQPNLHDYDGLGHSLISDTYDQTFSKYEALYKLPVLSLTLDQLGQKMQARNAYDQSGVTATVVPGVSITLTALQPAVIPVTGLNSAGAEFYGGQHISYITLSAGQSITLPLQ